MADGNVTTLLRKELLRAENQVTVLRGALKALGKPSSNNSHVAPKKKRKQMTKKQRTEIGKRMKAYWAKKKADKS
jgi:hypothetical protein